MAAYVGPYHMLGEDTRTIAEEDGAMGGGGGGKAKGAAAGDWQDC